MSSQPKKLHKLVSKRKTVALLIVFWPLGLYYLSRSTFSKKIKIILTAFVICLFASYLTAVIISSINEAKRTSELAAVAAAEKVRLESDPVTTSSLYNALNKERTSTGAQALSTLNNLSTASEQICNDMAVNKYFDYKNPSTGKESDQYIKENVKDLYILLWVTSIFTADRSNMTSTDAVNRAVQNQAENLNNPKFNSVGWATCQSPFSPNESFIVATLADKEERPASPQTIYKYVPSYTPSYTPPTHCYTDYHTYGGYFDPSADTTCY